MLPAPLEPEGTLTEHTVPHSISPGSQMLDDVDLIWGQTDDVPNREWTKLDDNFTNAGYREGITAGKESALQEGFDDGFASVGTPLGREIGLLRGAANAAMGFLSSRPSHAHRDIVERQKSEVQSVIRGLGRITLDDLAPPDLQAQEHELEHLNSKTPSGSLVSSGENAHDTDVSKTEKPLDESLMTKPAVEELSRLRIRLSSILQEFGLDVPLV